MLFNHCYSWDTVYYKCIQSQDWKLLWAQVVLLDMWYLYLILTFHELDTMGCYVMIIILCIYTAPNHTTEGRLKTLDITWCSHLWITEEQCVQVYYTYYCIRKIFPSFLEMQECTCFFIASLLCASNKFLIKKVKSGSNITQKLFFQLLLHLIKQRRCHEKVQHNLAVFCMS